MSGPTRLDRLLGLTGAEDPHHGRIARFVAIIATAGFLAALLANGLVLLEPGGDAATALTLSGIAAACGMAFWTARRGLLRTAGWLLVLTGAFATTAMVLTGYSVGFGDVAVMLYPVVVIAASLLLERRDSAFAMGLVPALLAAVLVASLSGYIDNSRPTLELLADFGFALLIVAISAVASWRMAESMEQSCQERRAQQQALSRANDQLEKQADNREGLIRKLEARNAELQHFTYTVSHDLKSPLVTIGAFAGCVEKSAMSGDYEQLLADLKWIKQAQERMSGLLTDLMELSRASRLANPTERVRFSEVVDEARQLTSGVLRQTGARLTVSDQLPTVTGDRRRLVQVMQNLLENAARFSGDSRSPAVEIGCRQSESETVFFVRDEGIGVEPAERERIFELFRKLPESPGTGVGLALVQRIIEAHGGRVWVESDGRGKGAEFRFTLESPR